MYWGHAVSEDLLSWKHMPVALAPDELGNIFSGSCVVDAQNSSGLFVGPSESNVVAFYTSSMPQGEGKVDLQTQSIAYSADGGATWVKWPGNPIIDNTGLSCFRDPKVIWFAPGSHWVMLLTHGQSVGIYKSIDLLNWELTSEFGEMHGYHSAGPWECPDLFELTDKNGNSLWVLVVGIGDGCPAPGSGTQYFIGRFNGSTFTSQNPADVVSWLDLGRDHYATQTWASAPQGRRVAIAWMSNWRYARHTNTQFFRGVMTIPRDLYLGVNSSNFYFVGQRFPEEVIQAFSCTGVSIGVGVEHDAPATFRASGKVSFRIGDSLQISLFDDDYEQFTIKRIDQGYIVDLVRRVEGGDEVFAREFPHHYQVAIASEEQELAIDMLVDDGAVEMLLDEGRYSITQLFFPRLVSGKIRFEGTASGHIDVHEYIKECGDGEC